MPDHDATEGGPLVADPVDVYKRQPPISADYFLSRIDSHDVTQLYLEDSYHVATLDNDAPQLFASSVDFLERLATGSPA